MSETSGNRRNKRSTARAAASTVEGRRSGEPAALDRTARRAQERRRAALAKKQPWWRGSRLIVLVVAVLAFIVLLFVFVGRRTNSGPIATAAETNTVVNAVTQVPAATFDAVGAGGLDSPLKASQLTPLTGLNSRPEVLYIGAEYCPYCASERWSLVAALSRFGSFTGLQLTTSTDADVFPNTPTFTFQNSQYSSQYIDFVAVETQTRDRASLQTPTAAQQQIFDQLNTAGSIPFVDIANRFVGIGGGYPNEVLTGKTWTDIASSLSSAGSPITQAILGNANYLTAAMCGSTGDQPTAVCSSPSVSQVKGKLNG